LSTPIRKVIVHWNNTPAPNAVNVWYAFDAGGAFTADLRAWYAAYASYIPSGVTCTFNSTGEVLDDTTGAVTGVWTDTAPAVVTGTAGGAYASGTGACFVWNTGVWNNRREIRGRTFMVPLAGMVDTDGSLSTGFAAAAATATGTLLTNAVGSLAVWHRPKAFLGGNAVLTSSYTLHDRPAFLNSRRR